MAEEIITETNRETATDHAYGGAQIQVLEGLEAVGLPVCITSSMRSWITPLTRHWPATAPISR